MRRYHAALLASTLLPVAQGVAAGEPHEFRELLQLSLEELLEIPVMTASKRMEARTDTPAHLMVITAEQIRDRRYRNLADLLEDLPGVDFMRGTKSSAFNNFAFQGHVSNNKLLILLDGVRIDHPGGGKIPVADNLALYNAKQVEVLYGPAAALYGADAMAGVINIISQRPRDAERVHVSLTGGSDGYRNTEATASARLTERVALEVGAHEHRADRADLSADYADDFPRVDAVTFDGTVALPAALRESYTGEISSGSRFARLDVGDDLTLSYHRSDFRSLTSTGDRPDTARYLSSAYWDTTIDTLYARYRFELKPRLTGELTVDYSEYEVSPSSSYVNIFTGFEDHGHDYAFSRRRGFEQQLTWSADDTHTLVGGLAHHDYRSVEVPDLPTALDPDRSVASQDLTYVNTPLPIQTFQNDFTTTSLYAQLQSRWSATLSSMLGLRYDRNSDYRNTLNPRLGLVWKNTGNSYLKLLYGEAFRAPSSDEAFSTFGSFSGQRNAAGEYVGYFFRAPNAELEPEESRSLSLTWDWRPRRDLNLVVNTYYAEMEDIIVSRDEVVPTQYIPGARLFNTSIKDNMGSEKHYGLDLIVNARFQLSEAWRGDLWGSYSYTDGEVYDVEDGRRYDLPYIARDKIKLGTTFRYRNRYTVTPKLYWIGDTNTERKDPADPGTRIQADDWFRADLLLAAHDVGAKGITANLEVYNLFDRRYHVAAGSGSTTFVTMPQQPRTVMLTVQYDY
ncbi:TonB-dependent receptor plug domain-containing protein [Endothiovibrio diazotrophicus]